LSALLGFQKARVVGVVQVENVTQFVRKRVGYWPKGAKCTPSRMAGYNCAVTAGSPFNAAGGGSPKIRLVTAPDEVHVYVTNFPAVFKYVIFLRVIVEVFVGLGVVHKVDAAIEVELDAGGAAARMPLSKMLFTSRIISSAFCGVMSLACVEPSLRR
jgi:hypothetical protein